MNTNIVIMGPIGVGKTSIAKELSKRLCKEFIDLDDQRERLYSKTTYSEEDAEKEFEKSGIMGVISLSKTF